MKKKLLSVSIMLTLLICAAALFAENDKKQSPKPQKGEKTRKMRPETPNARRRPRTYSSKGRETLIEQRIKQMQAEIDRQKKKQKDFISELEAIKKQAKKENAPKTADMLNSLIKSKNDEFQAKIKGSQKRLDEFKKRMTRTMKKDIPEKNKPPKGAGRRLNPRGYKPSNSNSKKTDKK